jgi:hypothetical protein
MPVDTVYQTQYRDEFIAGFEQRQSLLRDTVTTEAVIKGNKAIFLVADSGDAEAVTRGQDGLIPARADNQTQNTATLQEWHDLVRKTKFNIFASQGDQNAIMQMTTMAVVNRKIDDDIITTLNTGTVTLGSSTTIPSLDLVQHATVKLQNAAVPWDSNLTLLCQPSFLAYLKQNPEWASADYVNTRPWQGEDANWRDMPVTYRWDNLLVISHPNLPGNATSSEKSFLYHRNSIGHAVNKDGLECPVGYNEEQAYSYSRCSIDMGSVLMQNAGVINITHDGSNYA